MQQLVAKHHLDARDVEPSDERPDVDRLLFRSLVEALARSLLLRIITDEARALGERQLELHQRALDLALRQRRFDRGGSLRLLLGHALGTLGMLISLAF